MENGQMPVFFRYPDGKKEIKNLKIYEGVQREHGADTKRNS